MIHSNPPDLCQTFKARPETGTLYFTRFPEGAQGRRSERFSREKKECPIFVFFG
jgi:hypothetical protein